MCQPSSLAGATPADGEVLTGSNRLVEKRVEEMQQSTFCIITNADKDRIREEIKAELFLRTGKTIT